MRVPKIHMQRCKTGRAVKQDTECWKARPSTLDNLAACEWKWPIIYTQTEGLMKEWDTGEEIGGDTQVR